MTTAFWFMLVECYGLIIGFLCYAAILPVWRKLPKAWLVILSPRALFYLVDVMVRCTVGVLLFLELPTRNTITVTALCNSHVNDADGASFMDYKRTIGRTMCRTLNIIQPCHCADLKA